MEQLSFVAFFCSKDFGYSDFQSTRTRGIIIEILTKHNLFLPNFST